MAKRKQTHRPPWAGFPWNGQSGPPREAGLVCGRTTQGSHLHGSPKGNQKQTIYFIVNLDILYIFFKKNISFYILFLD